MSTPLKCNFCAQPAKVHWTQIINNKVHNVDLCEDCAKKKGVTNPGGFSFADVLLKAAPGPESALPGIRCEQCGFTQNDFKKHGRFGCPACYDAFKGMLEPLLDGMHKGTKHAGKVPQAAVDRKSLYDRMSKLELELTDAIKAERYEEAARYRDEINQMKKGPAPKAAS
jgi:protein arginine kinase activator